MRSRTGRFAKSNRPRFFSAMTDIYRNISREVSFFSFFFIFFSSVTLSGLGFARLNNEKQLTTSLGGGGICAYRVISYITLAIPLRFPLLLHCTTQSRTSPLLSHFLFYMIEDTILLFRASFYVIEDVLFPCSTFYFTLKMVDCLCMCVCVHPCR